MPIVSSFGSLPDGRHVESIRLEGSGGFAAEILTYGATVQALFVPDAEGRVEDVVLGHDSLDGYLANRRCFGATVGRYGNRIADAGFDLEGLHYRLPANDGAATLHGGPEGFDRRLWTVAALGDVPEPFVTLVLSSPDGDQGFPGALEVSLTYRIAGGTALALGFAARTDAPTPVNLTHHGYFNLHGAASGRDVLDHRVQIAAERFVPIAPGGIPLQGPPQPVAGTPLDFRIPQPLGARIRADHPQLVAGYGYDHCYCLSETVPPEPTLAVRVTAPGSGRVMELWTDRPGVQLYTGNRLDGTARGKGAQLYRQSDALCLEPQAWPDSPNRSDFPSAVLRPGDTYSHRSLYRFSTEDDHARPADR